LPCLKILGAHLKSACNENIQISPKITLVITIYNVLIFFFFLSSENMYIE